MFIHSSPEFGGYLYDHCLEFFSDGLFTSMSSRGFSEVLSFLLFGTYFSVSSFCLTVCVCFCVLGEIFISLSLDGVALCR